LLVRRGEERRGEERRGEERLSEMLNVKGAVGNKRYGRQGFKLISKLCRTKTQNDVTAYARVRAGNACIRIMKFGAEL
jgi:hypothetical protein